MTNEEGKRRQGSKWKPVDSAELKALVGLFIHLGARKLKYQKFGMELQKIVKLCAQ